MNTEYIKNKTSQANLQKELKQVSFYSLQTSAFKDVIFKLSNTPLEKIWALLVEDLLSSNESQISQEALGEMVGMGRQWVNEGLSGLRSLGLLTWKRRRFGANVYGLPSIYSDPRILKLLGMTLPRFKRLCDKLKKKLLTKFSTKPTTPINIKSPPPIPSLYIKILGALKREDKETGGIVNRVAEEKRSEFQKKREEFQKGEEFLQEDSVKKSQALKDFANSLTPEQIERLRRSPLGSANHNTLLKLGLI